MSDINEAQHPQDPAEGPDYEAQQGEQGEQHGDAAAQQNQERELNEDDEMTKPGGAEPPD
jgi:hypothetical protein